MAPRTPVGVAAVQLLELAQEAGGPVLHLTTSERRAEQIGRFLGAAAPEVRTVVFPPWDCLPFDRASPSREVMGRRMAALRAMAEGVGVVVTTPDSVLQRTPPRKAVRSLELLRGKPLDVEALRAFCAGGGYLEDERVDEAGEVAFRGEVIDVFPAGHASPYRLEVLDGRLEAIRGYDALSQRTLHDCERLVLDPATEMPEGAGPGEPGAEHWLPDAYSKLASLFDHLPKARLALDPRAEARVVAVLSQIAEAHRYRVRADAADAEREWPVPGPDGLYLSAEEWAKRAKGAIKLEEPGERFATAPALAAELRPERAFADFLRAQTGEGRCVVLAAAAHRDLGLLTRRAARALETSPRTVERWAEVAGAEPGSVLALSAELEEGFIDARAGVAVLAARDVLGSRAKAGPEEVSAPAPWQAEIADFRLGDVVVHVEHGVGVLRGLEPVETAISHGEAIRLEYAKGASLLVPVEEAGKLWRYGSEEGAVALDHLNTDGWTKRRAKIHTEMEETARSLLAVAAEREGATGPVLKPPAGAYERFAARFPYAESPDQRRAIEAVLEDMASGRPMDRLVVGDVGFGKTEVALRAAAAAALSGKQVAVVAPTTVLARQHFNTFTRRFADLEVTVAHLSRLSTPAEAQAVKAGLADGSVRLVVGTHALAGEAVSFADLGLLVIDEEQRFGAAHKTKLRGLGQGVHVLTLTATPIPRTLQTALVGLQDLSTIATAPSRRRPIRTFNAPFDPATVRAALVRENRRGGQSFVVAPRIEDIEPTAALLRELAPELDVIIAHGKLPAKAVDEAMVAFADGNGDVLLATSIIESGLDVPRANTMVVLRAELFGLAQLHQLRGRVGRGRTQGVCYLTTEAGRALPEATAKRLGTLQAFDRLGAGMAISARDLDLRGAGDLVGDEQAGHMKLIGLSLYQELLARALKAARGERADDWTTEIQIDAAGSIPPDYVPEAEIRLNLHHRLARAVVPEDVDALAEEIADRFGPPPPPLANLLTLAGARALARALRVVRITAGPQAVALTFEPGVQVEREFASAIKRMDGSLKWTGERLLYREPSENPEARAGLVRELLDQLS